ncbi:tripartite tricarboxylate transporter substrate-binding protein [Rubripirellula sp.]|nr:tripartite tricarboxylate transporter substrate-binding protein [Rubripirellula sp.]
MVLRSAWRLASLPCVLVLLCMTGCQRSTDYPSQPLTLLCPWSAGGGTDRVSRQVAHQLEGVLGVPVNVINATGGSGVTGHTRGAQSRADGYTLTMVTVELNMLHWRGLTSVDYQDFQPLHLLNRDSAALFVLGDSPLETLDQLRDAIVESPGKLQASGTAFGGIWHVAMAGWLDQQGVDPTAANWISINGSGPSIQELNAGGVDFICCSLPEVDALLASGKVRCLGVMSDQRVAGFEQVPTFKEQGHDWSIAGWRGLAAPRGIAPERLTVLQDAVNQVADSDELKRFMQQAGFNLSLERAEVFGNTLERQDQIFEKVLTGPAFASMSGEHVGPMLFPVMIVVLLIACLLAMRFSNRIMRQRNLSPLSLATDPSLATDSGLVNAQSANGSALDGAVAIEFLNQSGLNDRSQRSPSLVRDVAPSQGSLVRAIGVLAGCFFYWIVSESVGFVLTSTFLLATAFFMLDVRASSLRLVRFALTLSFLLSAAIYQLFAVWLSVPLPRGWWGW